MQQMVKVARLDHDLVYFGLDELAPAQVSADALVFCPRERFDALVEAGEIAPGAHWVSEGCDLAPGIYHWQAAERRFSPLPRHQRKEAIAAPSLERVVYDFITTGRDAPSVKAFAAWFEKSMDGRKA